MQPLSSRKRKKC